MKDQFGIEFEDYESQAIDTTEIEREQINEFEKLGEDLKNYIMLTVILVIALFLMS